MKFDSKWGAVLVAVAGIVGVVLLALVLPGAHPAAQCNIRIDREQSIARARQASLELGFDTAGWAPVISVDTNYRAGRFARRFPLDPASRRFTVVLPKVGFIAPSGSRRIISNLSSSGDLNRWQRLGYPASPVSDLARARAVANSALDGMIGTQRSAFHLVTDGAESKGARTFTWERTGAVTQRFEAIVDGAGLLQAELKPLFARDDAYDAKKRVRSWFEIAAVALDWVVGTVTAVIVFLYWAVRRGIKYQFVFSILGTVVVYGCITWLNYSNSSQFYDRLDDSNNSTPPWLEALLLLVLLSLFYFIITAAMDAVGDGARLATLRSLFSSYLFNRRLGRSVCAGLLCAPLILTVPLWISSLHLQGSQSTGDLDGGVFYAEYPALQAVNVIISPVIVALFGFAAGFLARYVRQRAVREAVLYAGGVLLFIMTALPSETSPLAFLLSASSLYLIYYLLYLHIDLLAALSAAWCTTVLWNAGALVLQPARSLHVAGIEGLVFVALLGVCAALVAWRGRELQLTVAAPAVAASQREKLMAEFSIAHRVQQQMLPDRPPEIPGCSIAASCHPANEVGGDLFDFLPLPDGRWTITVGDVSGKGVPAALYMTLTKGLLIATTQDNADLLDIITYVNGHIHAATERRTFVTMALGAFDPDTRTFDHVRAGHNPVVWRRPSENATSMLNAPGIGLGIVSERLFRRAMQLERLQLSVGDALVFYSDGLTEAMNTDLEQFGEERLMRAVEETDGLDAGPSREHILTRVRSFLNGSAAQDDMTLVVLRVN